MGTVPRMLNHGTGHRIGSVSDPGRLPPVPKKQEARYALATV